MLVARSSVENRQAILRIGLQQLVPEAAEVSAMQQPLEIPIREYRALIDTGAQRTCLTQETIGTEGLRWHGKRAIQNVRSVNRHYLFWIHLGFWAVDPAAPPYDAPRSFFALPAPVEVIDIASNYWFDAIIGMDVLQHYDLRMDRNGEFELRLA
jgi:hypothetical protein